MYLVLTPVFSAHSLDKRSEDVVNNLIDTEFADWTVIAVTHRLEHIAAPNSKYDQVIVLSDGGVGECGNPRELMDKPNSLFRNLVEIYTAL